jgi:histidinol-phosphate aminotransferase
MISCERASLTGGLRELGLDVAESQANFVWATHPTLSGMDLAAQLANAGVLVAAGDALGEPGHIRAALRGPAATQRLLRAVEQITRSSA